MNKHTSALMLILTILTVLLVSYGCKKPRDIEPDPYVSVCDFDDTVGLENETPLPVYAFTLHFEDCDESIALFRENQNYTGALPVFLSGDDELGSITFENSVAQTDLDDQNFSVIVDGSLIGTGVIIDGEAVLTSYAPEGSNFFYRSFDNSGWSTAYANDQDGFCTSENNTISQDRPALVEPLIDNDSGWGDNIELNYVFSNITGQYEACVSGIPGEYTIEWNINDRLFYGDTIDVVAGKATGIYFIAATVYHNEENVTISHNVVKGFSSKVNIRRARIRRPTGDG